METRISDAAWYPAACGAFYITAQRFFCWCSYFLERGAKWVPSPVENIDYVVTFGARTDMG